MTEGDQTLEVFVGTSRGELNAGQRAEVRSSAIAGGARATGGIAIELPVGASNERAAADAVPTIRSILAATSVPPQGIVVRGYQAPGPHTRAHSHQLSARSWPRPDHAAFGPRTSARASTATISKISRYWNHGCSTQRNLAAMVDDPADLVQPRGETPAYTMRRTTVARKISRRANPATTYPRQQRGQNQ